MKLHTALVVLLSSFFIPVLSQEIPRPLQRGPKGMDRMAFSEIVIFRDSTSNYDEYWFGVMVDNPKLVHAMINPGVCSIIRIRKEGEAVLYTKTDTAIGIALNLVSGTRNYVEMRVENRHAYPHPDLTAISAQAGAERLKNHPGKIIYRYMSLPDKYTDYLEDYFPDSIHMRVGRIAFHFVRPPSLEVSKGGSFLFFHNPEISSTYSEYLSIREEEGKGIRDDESLKAYINNTAKKELTGEDRILLWEAIDLTGPAQAVYSESENTTARNKGAAEHLHVRSVSCFIRNLDLHRNGEYHLLTITERGLPEELSTREELIAKFRLIWDSMRISKA
jgi:hypothetical protein